MGYPILALAVVEIEPETAGGVAGQHDAKLVDTLPRTKGDRDLFKRGVFSFAEADAIEGRASAEFLQVRNESGSQEAGFSQPAAAIEDQQRMETKPLKKFGCLDVASEEIGARNLAEALETQPWMLKIDLGRKTRIEAHGESGDEVEVRPQRLMYSSCNWRRYSMNPSSR